MNIRSKIKRKIKSKVFPTYLDNITKRIAKKYNVSLKTVEKDINKKCHRFGITYSEYYNNKLHKK